MSRAAGAAPADSDFTSLANNHGGTSWTDSGLTSDTQYWWRVRAFNNAGSGADSEVTATPSIATANTPPTGSVTIAGTATQGETLTVDTTAIADPDGPASLTFGYQWKRGGTDIPGATGATYTLTQADVGAAIAVTVSWTDDGGMDESLTSAATAAVANVNDTPTGAVTITGTATQGETLTAVTDTIADADGLGTFSYQWKRDGTAIPGATGSTYVLAQADVGAAITVTVSWTDDGGTAESLTSSATAMVANVNDDPTGAVTIAGTATQGETLTAVTDTIADPDGLGTFTYQWKRDGADIAGATGSTYVLAQADVGAAITVTVNWTDGGNTMESLTSAPTAAVTAANRAPTGSVTIDGTATQGETLTAVTDTIADADGLGTFAYQWKRDGADIAGTTGTTYVLTQADVGAAITVTVSWTDGGNTVESLTSAPTAAVANVNDAPIGSVTITGTATLGETLTAVTDTIADPDGLGTFSYQWKRDGADIAGATGSTYVLVQADVGAEIAVTVSWTDGGNTAESLTSAPTAAVTAANRAPTGSVTIDGTATQGATLTAVTDTIADPDGPATLTFGYRWHRDGTAIPGATGATYVLVQADVGAAITVTVSWTDAGNTVESLTSAPTEAVADGIDVLGADPSPPPTVTTNADGTTTVAAEVGGFPVRLTLPPGHGVGGVTFDPDATPAVASPHGVTFGAHPAWVGIELDAELPVGASAVVCLPRPEGVDEPAVYHLHDDAAEWTALEPASSPDGFVCGETESFSTFVVGGASSDPVPTFEGESVPDQMWTVGEEIEALVLPAASGGDGPLRYTLEPDVSAYGLVFDPAERAVAGTPDAALSKKRFIYTATDSDPVGADSVSLAFYVTIADDLDERGRAMKHTLAAFGRTVAESMVATVEERAAAPRGRSSGRMKGMIGGQAISPESLGSGEEMKRFFGAFLEDDGSLRSLDRDDLLSGSSFHIAPVGGRGDWVLWGRGDRSGFEGHPLNGFSMEGDVLSGHAGFDVLPREDLLTGLAINRSEGDMDWRFAEGPEGTIEAGVTSLHPYAHWSPRTDMGVWAMLGYGRGEAVLDDGETGPAATALEMRMAAAGARKELGPAGGADWALKADGFVVGIDTEKRPLLPAVAAEAHRLRLGLEGKADAALAGGSQVTGTVELAARLDGGDADEGAGAEVGGGLAWADPGLGLDVEMRGRFLAAHGASGFEEWGMSLSAKYDPGEPGEGLHLALGPSWGDMSGGADALWQNARTMETGAADREESEGAAGMRLEAEAGYGLDLMGDTVRLTPFGMLSGTEGDAHARLGTRLGVAARPGLNLDLEFYNEPERRDAETGGPLFGIDGRLRREVDGGRGELEFTGGAQAGEEEAFRIGLQYRIRF